MNIFYISTKPLLPEKLTELADSEHINFRALAAWHPKTPIPTLVKLSNDVEERIRNNVAINPNTSKYIKNYLYYQDYLNLI